MTKDRSASGASYGSSFKDIWSSRKKDMVFGSHLNPEATKITGLSGMPPSERKKKGKEKKEKLHKQQKAP